MRGKEERVKCLDSGVWEERRRGLSVRILVNGRKRRRG
jgi:hypothetical protein